MYKAKIVEQINTSSYYIEIPSVKLIKQEAHLVGQKGNLPQYVKGDLVIVSQLNDKNWVILGYVF